MTPAGALSVCPANAVDTPAASAPSSGNSGDSRVFGQQLRDARDSVRSTTDEDGPHSGLSAKRAAAREQEKKSQGDGETQASVPGSVPTHPIRVLPFSLDFGLMRGIEPGADITNTDSPKTAAANAQAADEAEDAKKGTQLPPGPDQLADGSQTGALPKELTFALKLDAQGNGKGGESLKENGKAAPEGPSVKNPSPVKSSATAVRAVEEAHAAEPQADAAGPRTDGMARIAAFQVTAANPPARGAEPAAEPRIEAAKALETSAIQTPAADSTSNVAGPLKELSIQVGQTPQDRVQVRLVDRAGEVQVAVRASNPDVAQGLRQGLSDLVGRLEQNGYRTEAWRPGGSVSSIQGTGESRQKEMQFQRDGSQSQSGGSQQGRQQNPQNQGYRPRWVQELEGSLSDGGNSIQGDSNGITN